MVDKTGVVFPAPRRVELETSEIDDHIADEDVLIEARYSLFSVGTELTVLSGAAPADSAWSSYGTFPFRPGTASVGEIVEVGSAVDAGWVGRRVATPTPHESHTITPLGMVRPVPEGVDDADATFFVFAEIALNALRRANAVVGESAVVVGLGLIGQLLVRVLDVAGARPIFAVDIDERRLGALPAASSSIVAVDAGRDDATDVIRADTRGRMADMVFEATGNPDVIPGEVGFLRSQGRLIVVSSPRGEGTLFNFHDLCNWTSTSIIGAHIMSHPETESPDNPWTRLRHSELFFDMLAAGAVSVSELILGRFGVDEAPRRYLELLEDRGTTIGSLIEW
jgi:2-desacetyl-2-hydroxyethyl bacteriochlorophyllide A dehydrogenase